MTTRNTPARLMLLALLGVSQPGCSERSDRPLPGVPVAGTVTAGPVDGARVQCYRIDRVSGAATLVAEAKTDSEGAFEATLPQPGPFLIVASEGRYTDEATGATLSLGRRVPLADVIQARGGLEALIGATDSADPLPTRVHLTALSTIASRRSLALARADAAAWDEAQVRAVSEQVGREFGLGLVDTRGVAPLDLTASADSQRVQSAPDSPAAKLGALVAAFSQVGAERSLPDPLAFVAALASDYEDGVFNGWAGDRRLNLGSAALGSDAGDFELAAALQRFLTSPRNVSGTLPTHFVGLTELMVKQDEPDQPVNRAPAFLPLEDAVVTALGSGQQVRVPVLVVEAGETLSATVTSSDPDLLVIEAVEVASNTLSFEIVPTGLQTGTATVTVSVKDDGGVADGGRDTAVDTFRVVVSDAPVGVFGTSNWGAAVFDQ